MLLIQKWMKFPVHTVEPQDSVAHAREVLANYRINQLPVVQEEKLVGIVTDRDLRDAPEISAISSQPIDVETRPSLPDPSGIHIESVMTVSLVTLGPEDTVERAAQLMVQDRIGGVPIVEKGHLIGILTRTDALQAFLSSSEQLRKTSRRERAERTHGKTADQKSKPSPGAGS